MDPDSAKQSELHPTAITYCCAVDRTMPHSGDTGVSDYFGDGAGNPVIAGNFGGFDTLAFGQDDVDAEQVLSGDNAVRVPTGFACV